MYADDQAYFYEMNVLTTTGTDTGKLRDNYLRSKIFLNKRNEKLLDSIVAVSGWPRISEVGVTAAQGAFLISMHAPHNRSKYLDSIRVYSEQGEALSEWYAYAYDFDCVNRDRPQLYGTQFRNNPQTGLREFYPIKDEATINDRRAAFGMRPIEEYAEMMGVKYTPPK